MFNGFNNKLANVPTITGLTNIVADEVVTDTLIVDGNDVSAILNQVPINTSNIATLQQITTGQTYASVGDTTTFDNNVTLTAGKNMTADNFVGLATNASQVTVVTNNSSSTFYPTFAGGTDSGQKQLQFDTSTTPLSYIPDTSTLSATNFNAGTNVTTPNIMSLTSITPSNSRSFLLNGTPIGNGGNVNTVCMGVNAGNSAVTMPNNNFCFGTNSGANLSTAGGVQSGVQNLCIGANSGNQLTFGRNNVFLGGSAARFTTTGQYNTQIGSQSQSFPDNNFVGSYNTTIGAECHILNDGLVYSTAIGAAVVGSTSNTVRIGRSADTTIFDGTVTNTIAQPAATDSSTKMPTTEWVQSAISAAPAPANVVTTNTVQNITANKTMFNADLLIDDGTGNNTSLSQDNQIIKITNNNTNGIITITGVIAATSLDRIIPTDGSNPTTAQILNRTITGTNIPNQTSPYFVSAHTYNSLQQITTLSLPSGQIQSVGALVVGMFITSSLGTNFSNGTYVTGLVSGTTYTINQPALNTTLFKVGVNFSLITASLTLSAAVPNGTIRFGEFAEFQFLTKNSGTTTMPLNLNSARMNVNVATTIAGNATVTGTTNLGITNVTGKFVATPAGETWLNSSSTYVSTNSAGSAATMRLGATATQTFIQAGATTTSGSFADIIFSSMFAGAFWATMNRAGLTMNGTCIYGRDDQFAFLTIPAGGLNQPIGFTSQYIEPAVTFTNNTSFNYTTVLPMLDNGVWQVTAYLRLIRGSGTFNAASQIRLSVNNSGTTNYYPEPCQTSHAIPNGSTVGSHQICMSYTFIVKSTVQERTGIQGFINMNVLGTATKQLMISFTKIA